MRNLLLILIFLTGINVLSSAKDRITLVEHFTSADCAPCAVINPLVDPIYASNSDKVVVIKYQSPVFYTDPMYLENKVDVSLRALYYQVPSVPTIKVDGTYASFNSNLSISSFESKLREASAINSTWDLNTDYSFDENYKNITINLRITSLEDQQGSYTAHIALLEESVEFNDAPGTNKEKVFYHVMRKMLPDGSGTKLDSIWNTNQTKTISETVAIPYNYKQLEKLTVVCFIQDNLSKSVMQATYAAPKTIDAEIAYAPASLPVFEDFETIDRQKNRLLYSTLSKTTDELYDILTGQNGPIGVNGSQYALLFRNRYNNTKGDTRSYTLPAINLLNEQKPILSYYYSYCPYTGTTSSDSLKIEISSDNGKTWALLLAQNSEELNTTTEPSSTKEIFTEWKLNKIDISAYTGHSSVKIRFSVINGNNNTFSIDQVKIENENTSAIEITDKSSGISIYPTVTKDLIYISYPSQVISTGNIRLFMISGKEVYNKSLKASGDIQETINISSLDAGTYLLVVNIDGKTESQKIIITK